MAFEKGNRHGAKRKRFEECVNRILAQDDGECLRRVGEKLWELAEQGERWAVEMLRDTLDGRPATNIVATDDEGRDLNIALIAYAKPDNDPVQVSTPALPAPGTGGTGLRH